MNYPCSTTVLDDQFYIGTTVVEIELSDGQGSLTIREPSDTVSYEMGNNDGYTACGDRYLILTNLNTGAVVDVSSLSGDVSYE